MIIKPTTPFSKFASGFSVITVIEISNTANRTCSRFQVHYIKTHLQKRVFTSIARAIMTPDCSSEEESTHIEWNREQPLAVLLKLNYIKSHF